MTSIFCSLLPGELLHDEFSFFKNKVRIYAKEWAHFYLLPAQGCRAVGKLGSFPSQKLNSYHSNSCRWLSSVIFIAHVICLISVDWGECVREFMGSKTKPDGLQKVQQLAPAQVRWLNKIVAAVTKIKQGSEPNPGEGGFISDFLCKSKRDPAAHLTASLIFLQPCGDTPQRHDTEQ